MAWTTLSYPFASLLTSTKMTQNQANFTAVSGGESGAPIINYSDMFDATESTASSSAFTTVSNGYIYMLANVDTAEVALDLRQDSGGGLTGYARMVVGGLNSDTVTETTSGFIKKTSVISLSTLASNGWVAAEIQVRGSGAIPISMRGASIRLY